MYHTGDNSSILVFDGILQTSCLSIQNEDIIFLFRQFSVIAGLWMNEVCFGGGDDCKKCHATNLLRLKEYQFDISNEDYIKNISKKKCFNY